MAREPRRPVPRLALSIAEAASSIGVSASSFQQMVNEGKMPPARNWHSRKLFLVSEIEVALYDLPTDASSYVAPIIEPAYPAHPEVVRKEKAKAESREMTYEDVMRLPEDQRVEYFRMSMEQEHKDRAAHVPGSPYHKIEITALSGLYAARQSGPIDVRKVKGLGWATQERLELRGFIKVTQIDGKPEWRRNVILTDAGIEAAKKLIEEG